MEMIVLVTHTDSIIIKRVREFVERFDRPLELNTDEISTNFPPSFPIKEKFFLKDGKQFEFFFPYSILNENVYHGFTNHQYHIEPP
jgi:hypothetical protein